MFSLFQKPKPAGEPPKKEDLRLKVELLRNIKELTPEQLAGVMIVDLNDFLSKAVVNELTYRIYQLRNQNTRGKSREDIDNLRNGLEKSRVWTEEDREEVRIRRELIEETKSGKYKL